jgi:amino acid adenylation domain-containing protein
MDVDLLPDLFARQAARTPSAPAVIDARGQVDYAALEARANQLAHLLRGAGAGPETLVGVCLPRGPDLVVALLGVWKAGAVYVPMDPDHPPERLRWVLSDTGAGLVVTDRAVGESIAPTDARLLCLDSLGDQLDACPVIAPDIRLTPDNAAYVIYTSGSTGRPKGVVVSHAAIANRVMWTVRQHALDAADRVLQKTTLSFDAAGWEIFAPLVSGGAVVLAPAGADRDPDALLQAVARHEVTVLQVVPSLLRLLADEPGWDGCGSLRLLFSAGEPLHAELCQRLWQRTRVQVWNTYGPTECAIDVTAQRVDPAQRLGPVPIGRPIANLRAFVLDPDGEPVPVGVSGELCVGGAGVARGYLGLPELTAERFIPDPYGPPGSRMYRTGDRVRWRGDGALEYLARMDDQVKVNGVRVEPGEVESALGAHPQVRAAVVTVFTDADGVSRLAAYVRSRNGEIPADELRRFLRGTLPDPFVPSVFVAMKDFPLTPSGKVDRVALPDLGRAARDGRPAYVAPGTPGERTVAQVWTSLLGVEDVGRQDDFFSLGGSSLLLVKLASRLGAAAGRDVAVQELFLASTVEAQARLFDGPDGRVLSVWRVPHDRPLPLSFGQHRMWFMDQMDPGSPEWATPLTLRLPAQLDPDVVRRALAAMVSRHEILRTRYVLENGEPRQVVDEPGPVPLRVVDLPGREDLGKLLGEELGQPFDLARGAVWRALLVRIPGDEHVLVLAVHHIASDGWSSVILGEEIREVCTALSDGRDPDLRPLPVQYADFAVWQRRWLTDGLLEPELRFWCEALDGLVPLSLPTDRPRPAVRDSRGAAVMFPVPPDLAGAVTALGRLHGATPFMTLLTAFATLLGQRGGGWDIPVGIPVAGRTRPEVSGVVGSFLNSLVLRCQLAGDMTFAAALDQVRQTSRNAFAHQDLPFERLVDKLRPVRDLSRTPLYQVMFDVLDEGVTATGHEDLGAFRDAWRVAKTDLTLYLYLATDGSMTGVLEYATALFDESTVVRMADRLVRVLEAVTADPAAPLSTVGGDVDAPDGVVEMRMAKLWAELLESEVGVDQNFFQIGGNSTLALRLVARIRDEFELDLPVRLVFERPTVARLAAAVGARIVAEVAAISDAQVLADAMLVKERAE